MANVKVSERAAAAVVGSVVADAAAMTTHWVYDSDKLEAILSAAPAPEFLSPSRCPFYTLSTGLNSGCGDQTLVLLKSLVHSKGFNKADYIERLYEAFGPTSPYEVDVGHPITRADMPIPGPWRPGSVKAFLANKANGVEPTGTTTDPCGDTYGKMAPLVALYAGKPELPQVVEEVTRVLHNDDLSVQCCLTAARLLEMYILHGPSADALETVVNDSPPKIQSQLKEALAAKDTPHKEAAKKFGIACSLPGSIQIAFHCLAQSGLQYRDGVRLAVGVGGDNTPRCSFVGACLAAQQGLESIPRDWIEKSINSPQATELAQKLVT